MGITKEGWIKRKLNGNGVAWNKGKKFSFCPRPNARGRIPWNKGKKINYAGHTKLHTATSLLKMSKSHKGCTPWNKGLKGIGAGDKSHFWRGGITPLVIQIRRCFEYRQWRSDVFTRDKFTCIWCGDKRGGNLNADHIKPFALIIKENNIKNLFQAEKCAELWNINNGRTLCENCHKLTSTFGEKAKKLLNSYA